MTSAAEAPTPAVVVRPAARDDLAVVVAFNAALARQTENKQLDRSVLARGVARALENPEHTLRYWVAQSRASGLLVGQAAVSREWSDWRDGWLWWLQSVYVTRGYRRRGVLRALLESIRAAAAAEGDVLGLRLYVAADNLSAQKAYKALGLSDGGYLVLEDLGPPPSA